MVQIDWNVIIHQFIYHIYEKTIIRIHHDWY